MLHANYIKCGVYVARCFSNLKKMGGGVLGTNRGDELYCFLCILMIILFCSYK